MAEHPEATVDVPDTFCFVSRKNAAFEIFFVGQGMTSSEKSLSEERTKKGNGSKDDSTHPRTKNIVRVGVFCVVGRKSALKK
jgi:hypothetical protein